MPIVTYEQDGAVGVVTMAKPPHNLIDETFLDALLAAYHRRRGWPPGHSAAQRHPPRAGADVSGLTGERRRRDRKDFETVIDAVENVQLPVVAAVHGAALGGGFELALTCDMIIAATTASFGMAEASRPRTTLPKYSHSNIRPLLDAHPSIPGPGHTHSHVCRVD